MAQADILKFLHSNNPLPNDGWMDADALNKLIAQMGSPQAVFDKYFGAGGTDPRAGRFSLTPDGSTVNFKSDPENNSWEDWGGGLAIPLAFGAMALGAGGITSALGGAAGAGTAGGSAAADALGMETIGSVGSWGGGTVGNAGVGAAGATGGGMNYADIFNYTPEFEYGNLSGFTPGDFTASQLPGGDLSMFGGAGGMVDLGGTGAIPGVNLGGIESLVGPLTQKIGEQAAKSVLGKFLNGTANSDDYGKLLEALGPAVLGMIGSSQQSGALTDLAKKYEEYGAPSRARYEGSFAPGFTMANEPGYKDALDQIAKSTLHGLSVSGNPADSPNAWMQTLSDINSRFAYPALQDYRRTNAGAGGLANFNAAVPQLETQAIGANSNIYNALGAGAANIFNPPQTLAQQLLELRGVIR